MHSEKLILYLEDINITFLLCEFTIRLLPYTVYYVQFTLSQKELRTFEIIVIFHPVTDKVNFN